MGLNNSLQEFSSMNLGSKICSCEHNHKTSSDIQNVGNSAPWSSHLVSSMSNATKNIHPVYMN